MRTIGTFIAEDRKDANIFHELTNRQTVGPCGPFFKNQYRWCVREAAQAHDGDGQLNDGGGGMRSERVPLGERL